ncbi:Tumor necrosis factor receptor superfamily member 10B [Lemmus lemmus]
MTLKLQAVVFLLLSTFGRVLAETVRDHPADLQNVQQNPSGSPCSPGFHLSDENRCVPCMDGIEYTSEPNDLPSCRKCSTCTTGEDEIRRCNSTQDTECQCKPGTFKDENSPEFCQKCSECTNEESEKTSCTPNTNRKCVPKDSQHDLGLIIGISVPVLLIFLSSIAVVVFFRKHVLQFMKRACPGECWLRWVPWTPNLNLPKLLFSFRIALPVSRTPLSLKPRPLFAPAIDIPSPTSPKPQKPGISPVHLTDGSLALLTKSERVDVNSSTEDKGQDRRGWGTALVAAEPGRDCMCVIFLQFLPSCLIGLRVALSKKPPLTPVLEPLAHSAQMKKG